MVNQPGSATDELVRPTGPPFRLCTERHAARRVLPRARHCGRRLQLLRREDRAVPRVAHLRRTGAHTQCVPYLNECQDAAFQASLFADGVRNGSFTANLDADNVAKTVDAYAWCICDGDPDRPRVSDGRRLQATVEAHADHLGASDQCIADAHNFKLRNLDNLAGVCPYVELTRLPADLLRDGWDPNAAIPPADHRACAASDPESDTACCVTPRDPVPERSAVYYYDNTTSVETYNEVPIGTTRATEDAGFAVGRIDNDALPDIIIGNQLFLNPSATPGDFSHAIPVTIGDGAQFTVVYIDQVDGGDGNDLLVVTKTGEKRLDAQIPDEHNKGGGNVVFDAPVVFGTPDQQTRGFALSKNTGRRLAHAEIEELVVWDSLVGNFRGPIPSGTVFKRAGALYRCPEGHFTRCWNATDRTRQPLQGLDQVSAATLATTYPANDERCLVGYAIGCYEDKEHTRYMTPEEAYKNDYYEDFGPHNIGDNRTGVNPDEIFGYSSACNQQGDARGIITLNYAAEDRVYIPPDGVCRRSSPGVGGVPDYAHGSSYSLSEGGAVPSTAAAWASVAPSPADGYEVTHYKPEVWCAWDVPPHVSTHWSQLNTIQGPACKQHVWSDYEQKRRVQGTELDHETLLIATGDGHASVYVGDMAQTIPVPLFEVDPTHLDGAESGFDISSWIHGTSNTLGTNYRPEMARHETVGVSVRSAAPMMLEQICETIAAPKARGRTGASRLGT